MPAYSRALVLPGVLVASSLPLACFSPEGTSATTSEPTSTGDLDPTLAAAQGFTGETTAVTDAPTVTATSPTTGGECGVCPEGTYCAPNGECLDCLGLVEAGSSCQQVDPARPRCDDSGRCVGCLVGTDCPVGVCHPELEQCVECSSSADCPGGLACDPETHTCFACREHADCPETACRLDGGTCFPGDARHWYVDSAANGCSLACSDAEPCCEVADAFALLADAPETFHVVHVAGGTYLEPIRLSVPKRVAVLGAPGARFAAGAAGEPIVLVGDPAAPAVIDAELYLSRLAFSGLGEVAVQCHNAAQAWLDDLVVADFFGNGLYANACRAHVRRSRFVEVASGFNVGDDGVLTVENGVVSGVGTGPSLLVLSGGTLALDYTTIALQDPVNIGLLLCNPGSSVQIRNSVVVSDQVGAQVDCKATLQVGTSVTSESELATGPGVVPVEPGAVAGQFAGWAEHDLRPLAGSLPATAARWQAGDPRTDIAGLARPGRPEAEDAAGAHLPVGP
ncbi:hypothetical protein SAMN02745121_06970 [Nannocystis exedens]|uniref:Right handed beta helix region n=1 Tax=Nannocystis exedens TaxID=54 RepID=A0A1I2G100_9BACT|nr:hypothetical protein [Nannocystis exedens]PCC74604.1 hypothetical protein NAEX_07701 [Nannocystis exedens]SFF10809.1 hypothetical protein SAMN02745121_06970 [Nannocystis exedens]